MSKYYPKNFNRYVKIWLLVCKRLNIFPKDIEVEFEKVLLDALKVKSKISEFERVFKFSREYLSDKDHNTVNFERIEDYILVERGKITLV